MLQIRRRLIIKFAARQMAICCYSIGGLLALIRRSPLGFLLLLRFFVNIFAPAYRLLFFVFCRRRIRH